MTPVLRPLKLKYLFEVLVVPIQVEEVAALYSKVYPITVVLIDQPRDAPLADTLVATKLLGSAQVVVKFPCKKLLPVGEQMVCTRQL